MKLPGEKSGQSCWRGALDQSSTVLVVPEAGGAVLPRFLLADLVDPRVHACRHAVCDTCQTAAQCGSVRRSSEHFAERHQSSV